MAKSYFYDESIADWRELVKGEQGERGPVGPRGPQGPAIDIETGLPITVDTSVGKRVFIGDTMIYGETGYRDVSSELSNFTLGGDSHNFIHLSRAGNTVTVEARVTPEESLYDTPRSSVKNLIPLPNGFTPTRDYMVLGTGAVGSDPIMVTARSRRTILDVRDASGSWASGDTLYVNVSWQTNDPWPTALPGTAA